MITFKNAYHIWTVIRQPDHDYSPSVRRWRSKLLDAMARSDEKAIEKAVSRFEENIISFDRVDDFICASIEAARVLFALQQYHRAGKLLFDSAIQVSEDLPSFATIHLMLGAVLYKQGNINDALYSWEQAKQSLRLISESRADFSLRPQRYRAIRDTILELTAEHFLMPEISSSTGSAGRVDERGLLDSKSKSGSGAYLHQFSQSFTAVMDLANPDQLHIVISLFYPPSIQDFFQITSDLFWRIEYIYLVFAIMCSGDVDIIKRFIDFVQMQDDDDLPQHEFRSFVETCPIESCPRRELCLVSANYESLASFNIVGIAKVMNYLLITIKYMKFRNKDKETIEKHEGIQKDNTETKNQHFVHQNILDTAVKIVDLIDRQEKLKLNNKEKTELSKVLFHPLSDLSNFSAPMKTNAKGN